jgi:nucleotide-binding universal stress UspA family protein
VFKKILICLDGTKLAEQILPYARLAALCGSKVVLLQVLELSKVLPPASMPAYAPTYFSNEQVEEQIEGVEKKAASYLELQAKPLRDQGIDVECVVLEGIAGEVIVEYAGENGVDLIAIATHGRSGLGRVAFGSVADFVLKRSNTPVLLIRPKHVGSQGVDQSRSR